MSAFRLSPEAEAELDGIWRHIARESGSVDIATRPYVGRRRDEDLRPGLRTFPADEYIIIHRIAENDVVLILHVAHGSRDIVELFGQ